MTTTEIQQLIQAWENTDFVFSYFDKHPEDFPSLLDVALDESEKTNWRAAWLIDKLNNRYPELIYSKIGLIQEAVLQCENQSKLRHFLKLISLHPINKQATGLLFDRSFQIFTNPNYAIAIRVHAMQILYEISCLEPELKPELILIIEQELELHSSAGICSRGRKIVNRLQKELLHTS